MEELWKKCCGSNALKGIMKTIEPAVSKMESFTGRGGNLNAT